MADIYDLIAGDTNLYNFFFEDFLKLEVSGDIPTDVIFKLLLPILLLYAFVGTAVGEMRLFGGKKTKGLLSAIIWFSIIYYGYYSIFVDWAMPIFVIYLLWSLGKHLRPRSSGGNAANSPATLTSNQPNRLLAAAKKYVSKKADDSLGAAKLVLDMDSYDIFRSNAKQAIVLVRPMTDLNNRITKAKDDKASDAQVEWLTGQWTALKGNYDSYVENIAILLRKYSFGEGKITSVKDALNTRAGKLTKADKDRDDTALDEQINYLWSNDILEKNVKENQIQ